MNILVVVTKTIEYSVEIYAKDDDDACQQIEALTYDALSQDDGHINIQVLTRDGDDITGRLQPPTPHLVI